MDEFFDYDSTTTSKKKKHKNHTRTINELKRYIQEKEDIVPKELQQQQQSHQQPSAVTTTTTTTTTEEQKQERSAAVVKEKKEEETYKQTNHAPEIHRGHRIAWIPTCEAPRLAERSVQLVENKKNRQTKWTRLATLDLPLVIGDASVIFPLDRSKMSTWEDYDAATRAHAQDDVFCCAPFLNNTFVVGGNQTVPVWIRRSANGQLAEVRIVFKNDEEGDEEDMEDMKAVN